jgi:hypothetical protein
MIEMFSFKKKSNVCYVFLNLQFTLFFYFYPDDVVNVPLIICWIYHKLVFAALDIIRNVWFKVTVNQRLRASLISNGLDFASDIFFDKSIVIPLMTLMQHVSTLIHV